MYLFFDVSANGQPKSWKASLTDPFNWPRLVHLSWLMYNKDRELIASSDDLIKPEGFEISVETEQKAQITHQDAVEKGVPLKEALLRFKDAVEKAEYVIAHNMKFNEGVVTAEFYRKNIPHLLGSSDKYCLMQEATWYCKLPGKTGGYKWPTLQEIHTKIFNSRYTNANNALGDVSACVVCFFALLDLEAIELFD
ncbi:MAG: 3'-5' exonuclease [Bacteroidetes bacterium]|nr:MAG: 3'-5' exonuclease [Bacteroidota bacterium]